MQITRPSRMLAMAALIGAALVAAAAPAATSVAPAARRVPTGPWHLIDKNTTIQSGTPALWVDPTGHATLVWLRHPAPSTARYEFARLTPTGALTGSLGDVFAGADFNSLSNEPTLLGINGKPMVVFTGGRGTSGPYSHGCIYGALGGSTPWKLQTWSLSNNCVNPVGSATEGAGGTPAAAWPGGWVNGHGALYRIGTSPTIPATGADGHIPLSSGDVYKTGMAYDAGGTKHVYVGYARANAGAHDGYYVKDVNGGGPALKAPGSGTQTISDLSPFADLAIASRTGHPGVYVAYCSNTSTCVLKLWRVGASAAMTVPNSKGSPLVSIAAGVAGRIWVAWYDNHTNRVSVVRTNKAASRFGPVETVATPCAESGLLGLGDVQGRLDVAMQCVAESTTKATVYATQFGAPLSVSLQPATVTNTATHTVVVTVSDVTDRVAGAKVHYGSKTVTTNGQGRASLTVAKGTKPGKHTVTATATSYRSGSATLTVKP